MDKMFLNISFSLLCGVFAVFFLSFAGFIFGLHIMPAYIILGLITAFIAFGTRLHLEKTPPKKIFKYCIWYLLGLISLVNISSWLMDSSWDGRAYHQVTVLLLEKGWNPVYDNIINFAKDNFPIIPEGLIWSENYVKFSEIIAANIFSVTQKIETGKAVNIISTVITFCYTFYIFSKEPFCAMNKKVRAIFSFILVYNPIVIAQTFTYYTDGLLYLYFLIATLSAVDIKTSKDKMPVVPALIFIMSSVIMMNIKLGGILCFICILLGVFAFWVICKFKAWKNPSDNLQNNDTKTDNCKDHGQKIFRHPVLIIILLTLLSGINPYFTNILKERHPLYPLAGEGKLDIITPNTPKKLAGKPVLYKFFISLFSEADNIIYSDNKQPKLKIPFTIKQNELKALNGADTRLSGFGVFFSGIFLLAVLLLFLSFKSKNPFGAKEKVRGKYELLFLILGLSVILNPENWWARYTPQLWAIITLICLFSFLNNDYDNTLNKFKKYLISAIIFIMFLNTLITNCMCISGAAGYTIRTKMLIAGIKNASNGKKIVLGNVPEPKMKISFLHKLKEAGIEYEIQR